MTILSVINCLLIEEWIDEIITASKLSNGFKFFYNKPIFLLIDVNLKYSRSRNPLFIVDQKIDQMAKLEQITLPHAVNYKSRDNYVQTIRFIAHDLHKRSIPFILLHHQFELHL